MRLNEAPPPLTNQQRAVYWIVAFACGASRFLAISRSLWDWDEALFCLGMRSYDVASHHPHPPGFPLYIAVAKIVRLFIHSDFRSLQAINLAAGVLLFPAMFMLARELRVRFTTSVIAGVLCAFFPNIWFFGGTAFSDVASIMLVVYSVAFFFRGCRDGNAYLIGTLLLALSVGIRPQNFLVGMFPAALATWHRARQSWRDVVFALLVGTTVVGVSYGAAIHATGALEPYLNAVRVHSDYIARVDSFRSPERPPLWRLIDRFFIKQYQSPVLSIVTSLFVLISIVSAIRTRNRSMLYNALAFLPFAISAWLMLDRYSVNRFAIGYAPMFAIFAADGISRLCHPERQRGAWRGGGDANAAEPPRPLATARGDMAESILAAALVVAFIVWTWPALTIVRREIAPSVLGVEAVKQHLDRRHSDLYVAFPMSPFIDYLLPYYPYRLLFDERALALAAPARPGYLLTEIEHTQPSGFVFRRERGRLWNIARRHYFEVALEPLPPLPKFVSGWYPAERSGIEEWRWMSGHSVTILPPSSGTTKLRIQFDVPDELMSPPPAVTFLLNGAVIDRFQPPESHLAREYDVTAGAGTNTLEMITDRTLSGSDPRELGLLVRYLSWGHEQ